MIKLLMYWFRRQVKGSVQTILSRRFDEKEIRQLIGAYQKRYNRLKPGLPKQPTSGGNLMIHLACLSRALYETLRENGLSAREATDLLYVIAWNIYEKMGKWTWILAGWFERDAYRHLKKATDLFRRFPFNEPSYLWIDIPSEPETVAFNCIKCPVAEYFKAHGLGSFCVDTWCALDFPLAKKWNGHLQRKGSIAGGSKVCDFRWTPVPQKEL